MIYHSSKTEDIISYFNVDENKGLPAGVADQRLEEYGNNIISNSKKFSLKEALLAQLSNHINIILLISAVLSLTVNIVYSRNWYSPILIFLMLIINISITVICRKESSEIEESIKTMNSPKVKVLRDSIIKTIDASLVVPGDILILETGDYIVADARIITAVDFRCNEVSLTGEDIAAEKNASLIFDDITPINERANMVFAGSCVVTGHAKAIVTETAMNTEIGKTVTLLEVNNSKESSLTEKLTAFGKALSGIFSILCAITFILSVVLSLGSDEKFAVTLIDSLINCVVLLISILPDGLPVTATVAVGYATRRLVKKGLIIKDYNVFDVLPEVSVICSDKTGTLTQDNMQVEKIFNGKEIIDEKDAYNDTPSVMILRLASLCTCQSKDDIDTPMYNDATELAIIDTYSKSVGSDQQDIYNHYPCLCKIPFDAERKVTLTVNLIDGVPYAIAKGAPDYLLAQCKNVDSELIGKTVDDFAALGMRIIAVTYRPLAQIPTNPDYSIIEDGMSFAGLIALSDAPQVESISLVEECDNGGIRTIMITGDHAVTARAVARRLGILKNGTDVITGEELAEMSDQEFYLAIDNYSVFARLLPDQKLRIVETLKSKGHTVAITGDSVNDAPALSLADVGIAMGTKGTDVARGSADIIMNNNRFASIISAVNTAIGFFGCIRKSLTYILSSNIGEFFSILICLFISGRFPLAAAPLLFINLVTDIFPVLSVISDGIKEHKPMHIFTTEDKAMFTTRSKTILSVQSAIIALVSVTAYCIGLTVSQTVATTMLFATLIFSQFINMITVKFEDFFFKFNHFSNLTVSVLLGCFVLLICLLTLTPAGQIFSLTAISFGNLMTAILLSSVVFLSGELVKLSFALYTRFNNN
ncbi:MAG: cation-translocating P-type ATPase [Ruminococcaceae bacterium]|nr:cation-translocating P-type ATPase [Oscillospiraceae bacterium]